MLTNNSAAKLYGLSYVSSLLHVRVCGVCGAPMKAMAAEILRNLGRQLLPPPLASRSGTGANRRHPPHQTRDSEHTHTVS